jgi:hypothetical protein
MSRRQYWNKSSMVEPVLSEGNIAIPVLSWSTWIGWCLVTSELRIASWSNPTKEVQTNLRDASLFAPILAGLFAAAAYRQFFHPKTHFHTQLSCAKVSGLGAELVVTRRFWIIVIEMCSMCHITIAIIPCKRSKFSLATRCNFVVFIEVTCSIWFWRRRLVCITLSVLFLICANYFKF